MKYAAAYLLVRNACATYCPADPNARGWKAKARCALTSRRSVASSRAGAGSPDAASWRCGRSSGFRVARWMSSEPTRRARPPREHPSSCFLVLGFSANPFSRPSPSRQQAQLGGKDSPSEADVKAVLASGAWRRVIHLCASPRTSLPPPAARVRTVASRAKP